MEHGPAVEFHEDTAVSDYKTRIGLWFFAIYGIAFAGFVLINTFAPRLMKVKIVLGLNLAVSYGFALILLAIIMGLAYNAVCTKKEQEFQNGPAPSEHKTSKGAGK